MKKNIAEFMGTFWLVLGGCGTAVLAGSHVGLTGISLAFGLTVLTAAFGIGHISGAHLNPAVTLGLWAGGRTKGRDIIPYIISQILGGIAAATVLYFIVTGSGKEIGGFAANGYDALSPDGYGITSAIITEFVMTFIFLIVIMGATDERAPKGFAGVAIGLALTLIHLISIPVTNTSVNPARSISQAIYVGGDALCQLPVFIIVPILGAMAAGTVYKAVFK
ncbi:MAG: aquaporin Z [Dysgonamonadaceae bacterium]|jgi:aquaporin Z|nr:aquaporin Z [Dysgonamonadaceae bacterium]